MGGKEANAKFKKRGISVKSCDTNGNEKSRSISKLASELSAKDKQKSHASVPGRRRTNTAQRKALCNRYNNVLNLSRGKKSIHSINLKNDVRRLLITSENGELLNLEMDAMKKQLCEAYEEVILMCKKWITKDFIDKKKQFKLDEALKSFTFDSLTVNKYCHIIITSGEEESNSRKLELGLYPVELETKVPVGKNCYYIVIDLDNPIELDSGPPVPHVGYGVYLDNKKVAVGHVLLNPNKKLPSRYGKDNVQNMDHSIPQNEGLYEKSKDSKLKFYRYNVQANAQEIDKSSYVKMAAKDITLQLSLENFYFESLLHFLGKRVVKNGSTIIEKMSTLDFGTFVDRLKNAMTLLESEQLEFSPSLLLSNMSISSASKNINFPNISTRTMK